MVDDASSSRRALWRGMGIAGPVAVGAGIVALFFGVFPEHLQAFRTAFDVPAAYTPIGAIALGYRAPDEPSPSLRRGRRPLQDVVHRGRFGAAPR